MSASGAEAWARAGMRVLIACEYSGRVRDAFLQLGHDAMSCDLLPTDVPGPHYQGDVRDILGDGWDLMVAHPDCTYLPPLVATNVVDGREGRIHKLPPSPDRWKIRSTTYAGIAAAMAEQWGGVAQEVAA